MQLLDEVKSTEVNILRTMHATANQENVGPQETQHANAVIEGTIHQEILIKTLQVMQRKILGLKFQINNNANSNDAALRTSVKGKRGKRPHAIFTIFLDPRCMAPHKQKMQI